MKATVHRPDGPRPQHTPVARLPHQARGCPAAAHLNIGMPAAHTKSNYMTVLRQTADKPAASLYLSIIQAACRTSCTRRRPAAPALCSGAFVVCAVFHSNSEAVIIERYETVPDCKTVAFPVSISDGDRTVAQDRQDRLMVREYAHTAACGGQRHIRSVPRPYRMVGSRYIHPDHRFSAAGHYLPSSF